MLLSSSALILIFSLLDRGQRFILVSTSRKLIPKTTQANSSSRVSEYVDMSHGLQRIIQLCLQTLGSHYSVTVIKSFPLILEIDPDLPKTKKSCWILGLQWAECNAVLSMLVLHMQSMSWMSAMLYNQCLSNSSTVCTKYLELSYSLIMLK